MGFSFDYDKYQKRNPADIRDLLADEYDYEYADDFDYLFDDFEEFDDDSY